MSKVSTQTPYPCIIINLPPGIDPDEIHSSRHRHLKSVPWSLIKPFGLLNWQLAILSPDSESFRTYRKVSIHLSLTIGRRKAPILGYTDIVSLTMFSFFQVRGNHLTLDEAIHRLALDH